MSPVRLSRIEKQAQTRSALLDAAERIFALQGVAGASLDQIAATAGFTKGAVYANFESKEQLLVEVVDRRIERNLAVIAEVLEGPGDLGDRLTALDAWLTGEPAQAHEFALLDLELTLVAARNAVVRERVARRHRRTQSAVARIVAAAAPGLDVSAETCAVLVMAVHDGLHLQRLVRPRSVPDDALSAALGLLLARSRV